MTTSDLTTAAATPLQPASFLNEIVRWSEARPLWQRDALRKLLTRPLSHDDVDLYANACKAAHGASREVVSLTPITASDVPELPAGVLELSLHAISAVKNVNALRAGHPLTFAQTGMTVVYGDNGSGKSGYTRIIRDVCRARCDRQSIHPNAFTASTEVPSAKIQYFAGGQPREIEWRAGMEKVSELRGISVFDADCAAIYVDERNDVAYRPFGLDLFDRLAALCQKVRGVLTEERQKLLTGDTSIRSIGAGTDVGALLQSLSAATSEQEIRRLAHISGADDSAIEQTRQRIRFLEGDNLVQKRASLDLAAMRFVQLADVLDRAYRALADSGLGALFEARTRTDVVAKVADAMSSQQFDDESLRGIGNESWRLLWEAARRFSTEDAYPGHSFPATEAHARCVLCLQLLDDSSRSRLQRFEDFVRGSSQTALATAREELRRCLEALTPSGEAEVPALLADLMVYDPSLGERAALNVQSIRDRRLAAIEGHVEMPALASSVAYDIRTVAAELQAQARLIDLPDGDDSLDKLRKGLRELEARKALSERLSDVLAERARLLMISALDAAIDETDTSAITRRSSEATREIVSKELKDSVADELSALGVGSLSIELQDECGDRGVFYHRVRLRTLQNLKVREVLSEGEYRAVALATFLAELPKTVPVGIVVDDPVSSLDHVRRKKFAARIVAEAVRRQVIVFTHDLVFLFMLQEAAKAKVVPMEARYLRSEQDILGDPEDGLPWAAQNVKERLGALKQLQQQVAKTERTDPRSYRAAARDFCTQLRMTWERAIEEVALNDVVRRFRDSVETQRLKVAVDFSIDDYRLVDDGMQKCSEWMHDQSEAVNVPPPQAGELLTWITELEDWTKLVKRRREKK